VTLGFDAAFHAQRLGAVDLDKTAAASVATGTSNARAETSGPIKVIVCEAGVDEAVVSCECSTARPAMAATES
jgi:hypothetical protein